MKFVLQLLTYAVVMVTCMNRNLAFAERMVRFSFNNGLPSIPLLNECTDNDYRFIDPIFNITTSIRKGQRNLRRSAMMTSTQEQVQEGRTHRELPTYPARCKNYCAGMAPGTCRASGCQGYRRSLQNGQNGELMSCEAQVNDIHDALDALISSNQLSLPCQRFLKKSNRASDCYDDVVYGEITGFTFITATRKVKVLLLPALPQIVTVIKENAKTGYTICNTVPFNIQVEVNPCVNVVNVTMTGPNSYIHARVDDSHPMTIFENATITSGSGLHRSSFPYGIQYLDPGTYTISAYPDNFLSKAKNFEFSVIQC